jgi:hypothetical protein
VLYLSWISLYSNRFLKKIVIVAARRDPRSRVVQELASSTARNTDSQVDFSKILRGQLTPMKLRPCYCFYIICCNG